MQTLESQLQSARTLIDEQQRMIKTLGDKSDLQGQAILAQQLAGAELAQKIDVIGETVMQMMMTGGSTNGRNANEGI